MFTSPGCPLQAYVPAGENQGLRLPSVADRALERQSAAQGISKSDLAREALRRYLRVSEFRTLRTRMVARAQSVGINTDDEVFDALRNR